MDTKRWPMENDDSIQCQQLTAKYLNETVDIMENAFYRHENACKAINLPEDPEAVAELKELTRAVTKDGVTVIAVDTKTNKVVGAAFNKLQVKGAPGETSFFENFKNSCRRPKSQALIQFMMDTDSICDLFDHCQVDCLLEIMFLGTLPEYRGKGIGKKLCEVSIELAEDLLKGINRKLSLDEQQMDLQPVPEAVSAIFTSFITQKIGKQLGFTVAAEKSYQDIQFEGRSYASVIGKETPSLTLEYKKLK